MQRAYHAARPVHLPDWGPAGTPLADPRCIPMRAGGRASLGLSSPYVSVGIEYVEESSGVSTDPTTAAPPTGQTVLAVEARSPTPSIHAAQNITQPSFLRSY
ncbi:hypothetical protein NDU88_007611 [Pleurodeles waltl]|uniref:Uncharacterized protein n=1 Tax=Pleurodeles waltl TaxID=8319 RepID=A0AAV7PME9_PLEWA|nr:hypothetical protein NDU88_007611 [Pleurodeles waltl]